MALLRVEGCYLLDRSCIFLKNIHLSSWADFWVKTKIVAIYWGNIYAPCKKMTFWSRFWNENCTPTFGYIPYIFSLFKQFRFSLHSHVAKALLDFNIGIVLQNVTSFWPKFLFNFKIWFKSILDLKWNSKSKILTKELFSVFAPNFRWHAGLMLCIVHHSCCSKFDSILQIFSWTRKIWAKWIQHHCICICAFI